MKMETQYSKLIRFRESSTKKEFYTNKCLHEKTERFHVNYLLVQLKDLKKKIEINPKHTKKERNNKD
jgi:hypothetical protein